jgi:hypothetical protein
LRSGQQGIAQGLVTDVYHELEVTGTADLAMTQVARLYIMVDHSLLRSGNCPRSGNMGK